MICPLCLGKEHQAFDRDKTREYLLCEKCTLVFVPREKIISPLEEKTRYDAHENSATDPHYISYLRGIADSIRPYLEESKHGLDFGCGRTTLLADLLRTQKMKMDVFDLYFYPDEKIWDQKYDFVVLSEVIEHLRSPRETMERLASLLSPLGMLFIKTKLYPKDQNEFKNWFYKRDKTHVQFFSVDAFRFLAKDLKLSAFEEISEDLFLLRK